MRRRRIIPLSQIAPEERAFNQHCFYCIDAKQPKKAKVKAVAVVEVEIPQNKNMFFGMCGNHAEFSDLTTDWSEQNTLPDNAQRMEV